MNAVPAILSLAAGLSLVAASSGEPLRLPGVAREGAAVSLVSRSGDVVVIACELGPLERGVLPAAALDGTAEDFLRLTLPGGACTGEIGKPALPVLSAVLDVPQGAVVELSVEPGAARTVPLRELGIAGRIAPALAPVPKVGGARARFALDAATYGADAYYPSALAEIDDVAARAGLARGHRLAAVRFHPVQYDPAAGMLRYYPRMTATVRFRGGDAAGTAALVARDYSPDWEGMVRRLAVNYAGPPAAAKDSLLALPVRYDIFYGGTYAAAAQRLVDWKRRKGYAVRAWNASGWTAQAIRDTILAQDTLATYLTIISDPDGADPLPASAAMPWPGTNDQTDLYYAETDGSGYLPDLFSGRISVKTAAEADIAVDKLIRYEQADFGTAGTAWLKRALLIAGYDGAFQWLGMATNAYCRAILMQHGYAVDTLVMADGEGKARIVPKVNAGTAWTVYSAHGGQTSWTLGGTSWTASQLDGDLNNADKYTLPVGHCCLSGDYQYSSDCFGETWPRLANKGGVSYIGSVPSTYWYEDDWLQRRYFDAIYDSIPGVPGTRITETGRFLQYGLYWIETNVPAGNGSDSTPFKQYYFEAYHVLGDPSMDFWTGEPAGLAVTYPSMVPRSSTKIIVSVQDPSTKGPVAGALVCAWSRLRPATRAAAYTGAEGDASLPFGFTAGGDTILMTVTKHDRRPHLGFTRMGYPVSSVLAPATVAINVPTTVGLTLTDPDSGNAPLDSVDVYLAGRGGDTTLLGRTDSAGRASFSVTARDRAALLLLGRRAGKTDPVFEDSILVAAPGRFELPPVRPNPFSQGTWIPYNVHRDADVTIAVYNLLGQRVRTLCNGRRAAGFHSVRWDGKDERGAPVAAGIYFCRLSAPGADLFQRMVLFR